MEQVVVSASIAVHHLHVLCIRIHVYVAMAFALVHVHITITCIIILYNCTVSGEANFAMKHTGLTIGGFTQPSVAKNLIDNQSNVEKGLCQRFLWILPRPTTVSFEKLEQVDKDFFTAIGTSLFVIKVKYYNYKE